MARLSLIREEQRESKGAGMTLQDAAETVHAHAAHRRQEFDRLRDAATDTVQEHLTDVRRDLGRVDLRQEFDRLHDALDRRERELVGIADEARDKVEAVVTSDSRRAPIVAVAVGVTVLGVVAFIVWRRNRRSGEDEGA
jgi:hypothetical protein